MTTAGNRNPCAGLHLNFLLGVGGNAIQIHNVTAVAFKKSVRQQQLALEKVKRLVRFDVVSIQGETVQLYKDAFPYCGQFF